MPISMAPLAIVLLIQQMRGSYAVAGVVTGVYAVGATLGTPLLGRLVDRVGQPRVIGPAGLVLAAVLLVVALAAAAGAPPLGLLPLPPRARVRAPPPAARLRGARRGAAPPGEDPGPGPPPP